MSAPHGADEKDRGSSVSRSVRDNCWMKQRTRRGFFSLIGAGAALSAFGTAVASAFGTTTTPRVVTILDARRGDFGWSVFLDGIEIPFCIRAELWSDGKGIAYCHRQNAAGKI